MANFESTFELYRQMAANIPDCSIYIFDHDFDYLLAEGEEVGKLGLTSESIIGCNFFEVWPQEVTMTMSPYYLDTLKGKRQKLEQTTEDGVFIQHFIPILNKDKEVVAGMVVSQNVSILSGIKRELNVRDEELQNKQRLFETVINTVGEGIIVSNLKGEVLLSNPAAEELLAMKLESKKLNDISSQITIKHNGTNAELQHEELPFWMALRGARLDGYNTQVEFKHSNRITHVESSARPLKSSKNDIVGAVLVMRDVSSRKELEGIVEENMAVTKEKSLRLERFVMRLSTNLLGPAANLNILYSLLERSKDSEEREAYIQKIGEVAKMLQNTASRMSNAVLTYTSIEKQWGVNSFEKTINSFASKHHEILLKKKVTLNCNFEKAMFIAYPSAQFEIIIGNLLENILQLCEPKEQEIFVKSTSKKTGVGINLKSDAIDRMEINLDDSPYAENINPQIMEAKQLLESLGGKLQLKPGKVKILF